MSDNDCQRASRNPNTTPAVTPMRKARAASLRVVSRCGHTEPLEIHAQTLCAMSTGRLKKNLSITPAPARNCHKASAAAPSRHCQIHMGSVLSDRNRTLLMSLHHLVPQVCPDCCV